MKGRKRTPYLVAKTHGDVSHRKLPPCPDAQVGDFDPPFKLDAVARKEWDRMRHEAPWVLAVNALLLAERCRAFSELQQCCKLIDEQGILTVGFDGQDVKNPACTVANQLRVYILRADAEMGITPCSQSKVNAPPKAAEDPIEGAMCG